MNRIRQVLVAALACAALVLFARTSQAIPRFSVRTGQPCVTCHVNPSGGGLRNTYGASVWAPTRLTMDVFRTTTSFPAIQRDIGNSVFFGADARSAYLYLKPPTGDMTSTFFQMQADLYIAANVAEGLTLYYDQGGWGSFEAMGIYRRTFGKYASAYVKAGRFMPTYGIRLENHNVYTRQDIGFGPRDKDQGVELGVQVGPLLAQFSALNGTTAERQMDDNTNKAVIARIEALGRIGPLGLMFGGSYYQSSTGSATDAGGTTVEGRTKHWKAGLFGGASLGRVTYLAEADLVHDDPYTGNSQDAKVHSFQSYQELDVLVIRGIDLNFNFEMRDPNLDSKDGVIYRWATGFELFPVNGLELKFLYRQSFARGYRGPEVAPLDGLKECIAMAHLYF